MIRVGASKRPVCKMIDLLFSTRNEFSDMQKPDHEARLFIIRVYLCASVVNNPNARNVQALN